jgi:hypothetical protein
MREHPIPAAFRQETARETTTLHRHSSATQNEL